MQPERCTAGQRNHGFHVTVAFLRLLPPPPLESRRVSAMPISATLEEFDTRILELERQLVAVKTGRNNLLPVHRLPPEIVAEVFKLIQHGCQTVDEIRPWFAYDYRWLDVMLVCRRFREVAMQTSALWNMVDYETHPPAWIQLCIDRVCNQTLRIRDSSGESTEHLHRAWSLEINGFAVSTQVLNLLQPTLRALHIDGFNEKDREQVFHLKQSDLHAHLALAYLALSNLTVQDIPVMHSLHRLELDCVIINTGLDGLIQMLFQVPSVQILCLRDVRLASSDIARSRPVSLPCLHSLLVVDTPEAVRDYLHLLPQPTLALGIYVECGEIEDLGIRSIYADILDAWDKFARSAHIRRPENGSVALWGAVQPHSAWSHPLSMPAYPASALRYVEMQYKARFPACLGTLGTGTQEIV
jgi:hypothetical protein